MQVALALDNPDDPKRPSNLELVTSAPAAHTSGPEQLPLIRMLEVVRDRVESIHAGQRNLSAELKDIKANLPLQRRPLSRRAQEIHILAIGSRRNGLCPCCQVEPVCSGTERLASAEFDHWYSRNQNRVTQTWLVCQECNRRLIDTDFKAGARSAFESYQGAIKPFLQNRQMPLGLAVALA